MQSRTKTISAIWGKIYHIIEVLHYVDSPTRFYKLLEYTFIYKFPSLFMGRNRTLRKHMQNISFHATKAVHLYIYI